MAASSNALAVSSAKTSYQLIADNVKETLQELQSCMPEGLPPYVVANIAQVTGYICGEVGSLSGKLQGMAETLGATKDSEKHAWGMVEHLEHDKEAANAEKSTMLAQISALIKRNGELSDQLADKHKTSANGDALAKSLEMNHHLSQENASLSVKLQQADACIIQMQAQLQWQNAEAHYTHVSAPKEMRKRAECSKCKKMFSLSPNFNLEFAPLCFSCRKLPAAPAASAASAAPATQVARVAPATQVASAAPVDSAAPDARVDPQQRTQFRTTAESFHSKTPWSELVGN
jgi:hypothetical protein